MFKNSRYNLEDSDANAEHEARWVGKIAPAVALLLIGESAFAAEDDDFGTVPEPGSMALLAAGIAAAGTLKYIRKNRRK